MTLSISYLRNLTSAFILIVLLVLPLQMADAAKKRPAKDSRRSSSRAAKHKKLSARDRRSNRRERLSARESRRGGKSRGSARLSRRDIRRERVQSAREQAALLKALERRRGRPLSKRERAAELRRMGSKRRREILEARRRAEAARRAAIARQRALDKALRDEVQGMILRDNTSGEDPQVRQVAINALGNHAGTVVVMDPMTGKVYSIVNQEWGVRRGFKPCSTIKLVTGVAGLSENIIPPAEVGLVSDRSRMDLTGALARSDNGYFERVGTGIGFDKMIHYAREMGLGEKTGANVPFEFAGRLPEMSPNFTLRRMFSYADGFEVTALQLGNLVSAMANGGKLLVPQVPSAQDNSKFKTKVRRKLDIDGNVLQRMIPGMIGSVNYGSGRKAYDPMQTVAGKTGTCNGGGGSWVGLFTSYAPLASPKLAVVVITRGTDAHHHLPAAVAGRIYRDLHDRFGTPTNLQIASTPDDEEKEVGTEEGDDMIADQDGTAAAADTDESNAAAAPAPTHKLVPESAPSNVKRVMNPINTPAQKTDTQKAVTPAKSSVPPPTQPDDRPRRTQDPQE